MHHGVRAYHIHIHPALGRTSPIISRIWIRDKLSVEDNSRLIITHTHHIETITPAGLFPFTDTPVHEEHTILHICHTRLIIILCKRTDRGIPSQQVCFGISPHRQYIKLYLPNTTVTIWVFHHRLPCTFIIEAFPWLNI